MDGTGERVVVAVLGVGAWWWEGCLGRAEENAGEVEVEDCRGWIVIGPGKGAFATVNGLAVSAGGATKWV